MEDAITQATARPARRRRSALNRVDLMLIVATTVAFVAVAAANHPAARARNRIGADSPRCLGTGRARSNPTQASPGRASAPPA